MCPFCILECLLCLLCPQKEDLRGKHQQAAFLYFSVFSKISPGNIYSGFLILKLCSMTLLYNEE